MAGRHTQATGYIAGHGQKKVGIREIAQFIKISILFVCEEPE